MRWKRNYHQDTVEDIDDLSSVPDGGPAKMILSGLVLPVLIVGYSVHAWIHKKALWLAEGSNDMVVYGDTAKSLAVAYGSIGLFCHFRWFWGLLPNYFIYRYGIVLSLMGFIGGAFWAFVNFFR